MKIKNFRGDKLKKKNTTITNKPTLTMNGQTLSNYDEWPNCAHTSLKSLYIALPIIHFLDTNIQTDRRHTNRRQVLFNC